LPPAKKSTRRSAKKNGATTKKATKKAVKRGVKKLSPQHKAAMAKGRTEAAHVRAYLDALEENKPRRGVSARRPPFRSNSRRCGLTFAMQPA
jgi:hypothetical protein